MTTLAPHAPRGTFRHDVRVEFARLFRPPRAELTSLASNAIAVTAAWTLLPTAVHDWLFRLTGPMAFAVVLQAWMLGDTTATNMLANDEDAALGALDDPHGVPRLLRAKTVALAVVVAVPCVVTALVIAGIEHAFTTGVLVGVVVLVAPFGAAAVAAWLGVLWPYRRRPLRWRWERRHARRRTLRWLVLVLSPFLFVPLVMALLLTVSIVLGDATGGREPDGHLDVAGLATATASMVALSVAAFWVGPHVSNSIARRRTTSLRRILQHPEEG